MPDKTSHETNSHETRNLRYTPLDTDMGNKKQIALLLEASASSALKIVAAEDNAKTPIAVLVSAYNEEAECPKVTYKASDGNIVTARFTEHGNLMLKVNKNDEHDYKHLFSEADETIAQNGSDAIVKKYRVIMNNSDTNVLSAVTSTSAAIVQTEEETDENIAESKRNAVQGVIRDNDDSYQETSDALATRRDSGSNTDGSKQSDDDYKHMNEHPDKLVGNTITNYSMNVSADVLDNEEETGSFHIPLKKLTAREALEIAGVSGGSLDSSAASSEEENKTSSDLSNDDFGIKAVSKANENGIVNESGNAGDDAENARSDIKTIRLDSLVPVEEIKFDDTAHGSESSTKEPESESVTNRIPKLMITPLSTPYGSSELYDASALDNVCVPSGRSDCYEPDFSYSNSVDETSETEEDNAFTQVNIDIIDESESAYVNKLDAENLHTRSKALNTSTTSRRVLAVFTLALMLVLFCVGFGAYKALSHFGVSDTSERQGMEDNTSITKTEDNGTMLIEDAGYDVERLTQNSKSFIGEFLTFKQSEIIDGSWETRWESYVDMETHDAFGYGDLLMVSQMKDWKESVKQHPAYNSVVKSFDSIRWELNDDSRPVCIMKVTLERPILDVYYINSPDIDAKVYQDIYAITFTGDYKVLKIDRKKSIWLKEQTVSDEERALIYKDHEEYSKYVAEVMKKAEEEQKAKKEEEEAKAAEEKARQEAALQEETRRQQEYQENSKPSNGNSSTGGNTTSNKNDTNTANNNTGDSSTNSKPSAPTNGNANNGGNMNTGNTATNSNNSNGGSSSGSNINKKN